MKQVREINLSGLVGVTHNYCGLTVGHTKNISFDGNATNPKKAAQEALERIKTLHDKGVLQIIMPPHDRPSLSLLKRLGFSGTNEEIIEKAFQQDPKVYAGACSAASMWMSSALTATPSLDATDGRVHFTPANLANKFHRSFEQRTNYRILKTIFSDENFFSVHQALPAMNAFIDEGASNIMRFCPAIEQRGLGVFVYRQNALKPTDPKPRYYPTGQTSQASRAISRLHNTHEDYILFVQQNPIAVDAGVYHNDVITAAHRNVLLYHDQAFLDTHKVIHEIEERYKQLYNQELCLINVGVHEVTLAEAVHTCLFNSQIIDVNEAEMSIIAPSLCQQNKVIKKAIEKFVSDSRNPITSVSYVSLREVIKNGGGPASMRLSVVLTQEEWQHVLPSVVFTDEMYQKLKVWISKHYRETLVPNDLADPQLMNESHSSLDELTQILKLGSLYSFQRNA
ncbi:MAG: N-succinylarginine dihydrolase [bacterium]|nr:N-succinylarginine dihydrolase [bacterium]MBU1916525.1 N-succinylarginine dihydrolase [bacterium]